MYRYSIKKKHHGGKLHVEFEANPEDPGFRKAFQQTFGALGFEASFDGHYFYVKHPDRNSPYSMIRIESDQWGVVWGEAGPWCDVSENHKEIEVLDTLLSASGLFVQV